MNIELARLILDEAVFPGFEVGFLWINGTIELFLLLGKWQLCLDIKVWKRKEEQ